MGGGWLDSFLWVFNFRPFLQGLLALECKWGPVWFQSLPDLGGAAQDHDTISHKIGCCGSGGSKTRIDKLLAGQRFGDWLIFACKHGNHKECLLCFEHLNVFGLFSFVWFGFRLNLLICNFVAVPPLMSPSRCRLP